MGQIIWEEVLFKKRTGKIFGDINGFMEAEKEKNKEYGSFELIFFWFDLCYNSLRGGNFREKLKEFNECAERVFPEFNWEEIFSFARVFFSFEFEIMNIDQKEIAIKKLEDTIVKLIKENCSC